MKTIARIFVCMSAMVCFAADRAEAREASGQTPWNDAAFSSAWSPYFTPASPDIIRNHVEDTDRSKCTCRDIKLYGKVKMVESFPDLKVKITDSFPDLKVKAVGSLPDDCGEWQFVESFPDFTIKYVESHPDIKIKFVESFPGM